MRRLRTVILALALFATACSADGTVSTDTGSDSATTTQALPSTIPVSPTTTASDSTSSTDVTATTSDRPVAPDFTLELGEGGSYTLSDGAKPVYLVFWAEW